MTPTPRTSSLRAEVVELAVLWRSARCSRLPDCDWRDGGHDSDCPITKTEQDLTAAIDALRIAEADEAKEQSR